MLSFVHNWLGPRANPIGIDFGTDCLRMAQVQFVGGRPTLFAAASQAVPFHLRHDPAGRLAFLADTAADLFSTGKFHGRSAVLALPAATTFVHRMTADTTDANGLQRAVEKEAFRHFDLGPETMFLRHVVAQDAKQVMIFGARRSVIEQYLNALDRANLEVIGMNLEAQAQVDCFGHIYQRENDHQAAVAMVDLGAAGTRLTIARGGRVQYAKSLAIGGDHFSAAVGRAANSSLAEARLLRLKLAHCDAVDVVWDKDDPSIQLGDFSPTAMAATQDISRRRTEMDSACSAVLLDLVTQLAAARREFEKLNPECVISRLIFVGGEAGDRRLCLQIARGLQVAAQIGNPLLQMGGQSILPIESGIDRRKPQPAWTVAIGLSLGPARSKNEPKQPVRRRIAHRAVSR